ncbi:Uncharacterized protein PCOAH_00011570 [Plasmodium coatneyi]|uniref:Ubiquitin-like domain-containing protein n=1 Tax=Plasmodium coatneyi TaxID=208452 RepID=A0A1B1DVL5_9APIC|nr:Uncharacterized protein PCOAH_00011570 [Plasmodium coatneyi]ANQ06784.1 Uncharacterized protein PCOAH_00011570 [Plasmodium coatneyi]
MVGKGVCWNAAICLCCLVLVSICNSVKLSRYQHGRPLQRSCLMDVSASGMLPRKLRKGENEPIKAYTSADKCSPTDKHNFANQNNPPGRWNILISCYDQWDAFRNSFLLTVNENQCVRDIKQQIEWTHGIPASLQQILYQGKSLADNVVIKKLTKGIKIHLLNLTLVTMLPHIFPSQYKKLLDQLEEKNYVVCEEDIANSFSAFDKGFPKMVHAKGVNLDKVKKEIEELRHVDRKKLLLRLGVDFPLMSDQLVDRFKELLNFYYLGDIKSVVKFSLFFFILYKYANYPPYVKRLFLYLSICFLLSPWKAVYMLFHFSFFFVPRGMLFPGLTNILSASYQQILMCQ